MTRHLQPRPLILSVDDDPDIQELLTLLLESAGYAVQCVSDGRQALVEAPRLSPALMLLDVSMPGLDGYEVCRRLAHDDRTAFTPTVFLSASSDEQDQARAFAVGAVDYLCKPIDPEALLAKVAVHLETGRRWREWRDGDAVATAASPRAGNGRTAEFSCFQEYLCDQLRPAPAVRAEVLATPYARLHALLPELGIRGVQLARCVAEYAGVEFVPRIDAEQVVLGALPTAYCRANQLMVIETAAGERLLATTDPLRAGVDDLLRGQLEQPCRLVVTTPDALRPFWELTADVVEETAAPEEAMDELQQELLDIYRPWLPEASYEDEPEDDTPVIRLVQLLLERAQMLRASDVHIEPQQDAVVVRLRVDGHLQVIGRFEPASLIRPIASRIKVMANLDIAERRLPQDGRFGILDSDGAPVLDLRVSTMPTRFGEKVVLRVLDARKSVLNLTALGFSPRQEAIYRQRIQLPHGIILHCGPTGSGKSMSLYAALADVSSEALNIQTAEDPIEYTLEGITQVQVQPEIGLTFARALEGFLRQDPDVILVGEIRNPETARVAMQAAMTGHLVFSTLHTNDAPSALLRLVELGVDRCLVSSAVELVCAQRLVRRLCSTCKRPCHVTAEELALLGPGAAQIYRPHGCLRCHQLGYWGRIGIYELLVPDEPLRMAVSGGTLQSDRLGQIAAEGGMTRLYWDAVDKVRRGICSLEDVLASVPRENAGAAPAWLTEPAAHEPRVA